MDTAPLEIGVIGLGHVYRWQSEALKHIEGIDVVSACDVDSAKRRLVDVDWHEDPESLLRSRVPAVLISAPVPAHYALARKTLLAGKDVLLEKPATLRMDELEDLYRTAESVDRLLVVAYHAAFARDLLWWLNEDRDDLGALVSIRAGFYDPYLEDDRIQPRVRSLVDCWIDSGVNALSVLDRIGIGSLEVIAARHSRVRSVYAGSIQATVELSFDHQGRAGHASIDTNWTLGLNRKSTTLVYETGDEILLDHSAQSVRRRDHSGRTETLVDLSGRRERLVEHYIGVFRDFTRCVRQRVDNHQTTLRVHRALFAGASGHADAD